MTVTDIIRATEFTADRVWGKRSIANMNGITVPRTGQTSPTNGTLMTVRKCLP